MQVKNARSRRRLSSWSVLGETNYNRLVSPNVFTVEFQLFEAYPNHSLWMVGTLQPTGSALTYSGLWTSSFLLKTHSLIRISTSNAETLTLLKQWFIFCDSYRLFEKYVKFLLHVHYVIVFRSPDSLFSWCRYWWIELRFERKNFRSCSKLSSILLMARYDKVETPLSFQFYIWNYSWKKSCPLSRGTIYFHSTSVFSELIITQKSRIWLINVELKYW